MDLALLGRVLARFARECRDIGLIHLRPRLENRRRARRLAAFPEPGKPEQILAVQLADIGDLVLSGPFLRGLRARHPGARIVLATAPHTAALARACPHVDEVVTFDFKALAGPGWRHRTAGCHAWWREAAALCRRVFPGAPPDLAVSLRTNRDVVQAAAQILIAASHARRRAACPVKRLLGYLRSALLLDEVIPPPNHGHEVERQARILAALDPKPKKQEEPGPLEAWITPETVAQAAAVRQGLGWPEGLPLVGLGIGAGHAEKIWPASYFAALARELRGCGVVLIGGPEDRAAGETILREAALPHLANLAGALPLEVTAAFLSHCALFIGNDSGPLHLAAAADVPVVGLYSREDPARWRPWTRHHAVLREPQLDLLPPDAVLWVVRELCPGRF